VERHVIAYLLLALTVLAVAALLAFKRHHSRDRSYRRRLKRERVDHARTLGERAGE